MRKSKFTEKQIAFILKPADDGYRLRRRTRAPEATSGEPEPGQGNALGRHPPKNVKPCRARTYVDYLRDSYRISIRRACRAYPLDRSTHPYRSRRADQAPLRQRIHSPNRSRASRHASSPGSQARQTTGRKA